MHALMLSRYHHFLLWEPSKRLLFYKEVSDFLADIQDKRSSGLFKAVESLHEILFNHNWEKELDPRILRDLRRRGNKYYGNSMYGLLRAIRNSDSHFLTLSREVQVVLGETRVEFENYYSSRFARLLMEVYKVLQIHCGHEKFFQKYCTR